MIDSFIDEINCDSQDTFNEMDNPGRETPEGPIDKNKLYNEIKTEIKSNYIHSILDIYNIIKYECPNHNKNEDKKTYSIESDYFLFKKIMEKKVNRNSSISIKECFDHIQKERYNNEFFCDCCRKIVKGKSNEKIFLPPNILTIILNRGHGKTFKGKVEIDTLLNISDYIDINGKIINNYNAEEEYYKF